MIKTKLYIDNIYWERVQLFIEGHVDNLNIEKSEFVLRNLTETKELKANQVEINENRFICRFNVAILDNGYY
ncbi:CDP-glycerol glycerophosphotransferase family protein, partial [Staphylococcus warneri]